MRDYLSVCKTCLDTDSAYRDKVFTQMTQRAEYQMRSVLCEKHRERHDAIIFERLVNILSDMKFTSFNLLSKVNDQYLCVEIHTYPTDTPIKKLIDALENAFEYDERPYFGLVDFAITDEQHAKSTDDIYSMSFVKMRFF